MIMPEIAHGPRARDRKRRGRARLLCLIPSAVRGGAEEYALTIASAAAARFEVHAAFPDLDEMRGLAKDFADHGVAYHPLSIQETCDRRKENRRHILRMLRTAALLVRLRPDVVHVTLCFPDIGLGSLIATRLLAIPTVVVFQLVPQVIPFGRRKLWLYRWIHRGPQAWVASSEYARKTAAETFRISSERFMRIYNAPRRMLPTPTESSPSRDLRTAVRKELSLSDDTRLLLTVGRLHPQKGYADLARAVPYVVQPFPDVRFVWVGEGEQRSEIEELLRVVGASEHVRLTGFRQDTIRLMAAADLFVFPTRYEGFSIALVEAMASGLPIVSSDCTSIPELIEDGINGVLFRTGDALHMLDRLLWALRHPSEMAAMASTARVRVADFSTARMTSDTLGVLERLLGRCND